jgi:hypothetical protein
MFRSAKVTLQHFDVAYIFVGYENPQVISFLVHLKHEETKFLLMERFGGSRQFLANPESHNQSAAVLRRLRSAPLVVARVALKNLYDKGGLQFVQREVNARLLLARFARKAPKFMF